MLDYVGRHPDLVDGLVAAWRHRRWPRDGPPRHRLRGSRISRRRSSL